MKRFRLNATDWSSPDDFYEGLLPQLGSPEWHGHLDALYDSLGGGVNAVDPPFVVEVDGAGRLSPELTAFLNEVARVFHDARKEFGAEVSLVLL